MVRRRGHWIVLLLVPLLLGSKCGGGDGSSGGRPVIQRKSLDPAACVAVVGAFPSGFAMLPGGRGHAALVQFSPQAIVPLDLNTEPPSQLSEGPLRPLVDDSDGDGVEDGLQVTNAGFRFPLTPNLVGALALREDLVLVSASLFEEILFWEPLSGELVVAEVENPPSGGLHSADAYPFLPPEGTSAARTAISTKRCIYPGDRPDSRGDPIPAEPMCDPSQPSFFSKLTDGKAVAAGHLFVATSNLRKSSESRFYPGTVLVYDFELDAEREPISLRVRPDIEAPVIFTEGFNPTSVARHVTATGRELVLVTNTGAIGASAGSGNIEGDASIAVIDAASRRLAATIPLGPAGPFNQLAIAPSGRVALTGASSQRHLFGVDLAPLDNEALYDASSAPTLDGSDESFPDDARIFTAAHPLVIPPLAQGGPDPHICAGLTDVAIDHTGREAYAVDHCDGTLTIIRIDLEDHPEIPISRERFTVGQQQPALAPLVPASLDRLRAPGLIRVRPGRPGSDFTSPDVYLVAGLPEGELCGLRINSFAP
jgi:hypothetical protein